MSVGKKPVHSVVRPGPNDSTAYSDGITYREWLIGMALQGAMARNNDPNVRDVVARVDTFIYWLDNEHG